MFLFSWNVAGLSTTVSRIHDLYGSTNKRTDQTASSNGNNATNKKPSSARQTKHQCQALADYFERHGSPDIVCLQEHKIPKSQLSNRSEPRGCAHVEGYESFWSCCVDEKSKGMNGVCTYAKKGTVLKANAFPFDDAPLDDQGRCVMTDHGKFVVFNVYVPASGGHSLTKKMQFLQALRRAMKRQRQEHQKAVVLVGDLNISHGKLDTYWKNRVLHVNDILEQVQNNAIHHNNNDNNNHDDKSLPLWKWELAKAWPLLVDTIKTRKAVPTQTSNSLTGAKYDRYRLCVTMQNPERTIFLGKPESCPEYCYCGYDFDLACHYTDPDTDEVVPACEANVIQLNVLAEMMSKIAKVEWSEDMLRSIADSEDAGRSRIHPPRQWLTALLEEDDMVDVFRYFYPTAQARFTCHNQFTNKRYTNEGSRIDYTIVDRSLLPYVQRGGPLRTGEVFDDKKSPSPTNNNDLSAPKNTIMDPSSEEAALAAATARGGFQPVRFEGGGIMEASKQTLNTQFGPRHTGMVYTPPSFSDHIAVSLLIGGNDTGEKTEATTNAWQDETWGELLLNEKDPDTKRAQPHKTQTSIASFFQNGNNSVHKKPSNSSVPSRTLPQKRSATATQFKSFFQSKPTPESQNVAPNQSQGKGRSVKAKTVSGSKAKSPPPHSILKHFTKK